MQKLFGELFAADCTDFGDNGLAIHQYSPRNLWQESREHSAVYLIADPE